MPSSHPIFSDDMREIVESFVVETHEVFERLDNDLLLLEQNASDSALVDEIFRAVHTVKGTSGFLSLEQLNQLAHHFEEVLNLLRRGKLDFQPFMLDVMLDAFDLMKVLLQQVIDEDIQSIDLTPIIARLDDLVDAKVPAPAESTDDSIGTPPKEEIPEETPAKVESRKKVAEVSSDPDQPAARRQREMSSETIRVDVDRLDNLLNLVGELVLGRNRLSQLIADSETTDAGGAMGRELVETGAQIDFITTELQSAIMHTRMVQIGRVFNKFPRVVRDLAREFDKQINLEIEGQETELDKSLIEEIGDPLVHLIRNAADHGIEVPERRRAAGKPESGTVRLTAAHEGNHVAISICDDGAGMDAELLRRKAVEKGVITEREATEMSDEEAFQLIFRPGFSTAKTVSKVSGRGVGMDVVKTNITRFNGTVSIESVLGQGTTFTLRLPLTLAIIQSLLVRVAGETFAIPLHSVVEVVHLGKHPVSTIQGRAVLRLRERVLPLIRTGEALEVPGSETAVMEQQNAVIVAIAHHRLGFVVDELVGQKEIVIKPLGNYLRKVPGIAGSTILGDGRVILILDIGELLRMYNGSPRATGKSVSEAA
ncbi:MAG: chemotaxis protein CheA [Bacteroidota bacterium]